MFPVVELRSWNADEEVRGAAIATGPGSVIAIDALIAGDENRALLNSEVYFEGRQYAAELAWYTQESHLVCFEVPGLSPPALRIRPSRTLRIGDAVCLVTGDSEPTVGTVTRLTRFAALPYERRYAAETDIPAGPGSAGAGLFDVEGHLVGIATGMTDAGTATCSPAETLEIGGLKPKVRKLIADGRWGDARAVYRNSATKMNYHDPDYHAGLAFCYQKHQHYMASLRWLQRAIRFDPENAWAHYALGRAWWALGAQPEAMKALGTAVSLDPQYAPALKTAADNFGKQGWREIIDVWALLPRHMF